MNPRDVFGYGGGGCCAYQRGEVQTAKEPQRETSPRPYNEVYMVAILNPSPEELEPLFS